MTGISIANIPKGSKLMMLGDWYLKPGCGWYVSCYFTNPNKELIRKGLPIDLLPALTTGTTYPRTSVENKVKGYTGTFRVPNMSDWQVCKYGDMPHSLLRLQECAEQIENQVVYRLNDVFKTYWLPASELARMLFFQSAEVLRAAVYQGNTWQLATAESNGWLGKVVFDSSIPISYLNSIQYRKFFGWMLFDEDADDSFCSIFRDLNRNSTFYDDIERWTFGFEPPDIGGCEISWVGYTGRNYQNEHSHCYIREIRSISGLRAPQLQAIEFSHPDDVLFIESEKEEDPSDEDKPPKGKKPGAPPKEIDPNNPPPPKKKRYMIKVTSSGFHFDTEIDLRRSPRQIKALPKGEKPELEEEQNDDSGGMGEGEKGGKGRRLDAKNLDDPNLLEAPEKIKLFQTMLEKLVSEHGWTVDSNMGDVPKKRCRSAHLVDGRARKYCHAIVKRDETTQVQILEIELRKNESLSTLFFKASDDEASCEEILDALMTSDASLNYKAMQWKRQINVEQTTSRLYLEHPDSKISNEEALESWCARAADRIQGL